MTRLIFLLAAMALTCAPRASADDAIAKAETRGEGRPVLFIPGLNSGANVWSEIVADLSADYETHAVTLAGFAGAPPVEGDFLPTRRAALIDYIIENDLEDVAVVGHSLGGFLALDLALAAPERVGEIVIVDSLPFLGQLFLGAPNAAAAAAPAAAMRDRIASQSEAAFEAEQRRFALGQAQDEADRTRVVEASLASDRETMAAAMHALLTTDLRAAIAAIEAPILVVYPWREGAPFTREQADAAYAAQYAAAPNVSFKRIDGSAHFIMYDQPAALIDAIETALED